MMSKPCQDNFFRSPSGAWQMWGQALDILISNRFSRNVLTGRIKSLSICASLLQEPRRRAQDRRIPTPPTTQLRDA